MIMDKSEGGGKDEISVNEMDGDTINLFENMIVISAHQAYLGLYPLNTRNRLCFLVPFVVSLGLGHVISSGQWAVRRSEVSLSWVRQSIY